MSPPVQVTRLLLKALVSCCLHLVTFGSSVCRVHFCSACRPLASVPVCHLWPSTFLLLDAYFSFVVVSHRCYDTATDVVASHAHLFSHGPGGHQTRRRQAGLLRGLTRRLETAFTSRVGLPHATPTACPPVTPPPPCPCRLCLLLRSTRDHVWGRCTWTVCGSEPISGSFV